MSEDDEATAAQRRIEAERTIDHPAPGTRTADPVERREP